MFVKLKDRTDQMIFIFYFQFKTFSFSKAGAKLDILFHIHNKGEK